MFNIGKIEPKLLSSDKTLDEECKKHSLLNRSWKQLLDARRETVIGDLGGYI